MESRKRSAIKTVCWHFIATSITACIIYVAIGRIGLVLAIAAIDIILNMIAYYLHERIWDRVSFGRDKDQTSS